MNKQFLKFASGSVPGVAFLVLTGLMGCTPASDRQQTQVQPASEVIITMTKEGRATLSSAANSEPTDQEAADETASDSEK